MNDNESMCPEAVARDIAGQFALPWPVGSVEPYGDGLINATFVVTAENTGFILQRINSQVFPEPERIMSNLSLLQGHLSTHVESGLRIPALIPARNGSPFVRDRQGGIWRMLELIPNTRTLTRIEDRGQAREVGRVLGRFHVLVRDLPPDQLAVTLPGFHVTPAYLEHLTGVLQRVMGDHPDEIAQAIQFVTARQKEAGVLEQAQHRGRVPMRVIHGDPKLDNILFDRSTGSAVSLIDLDTVQPGLVHYDLGDCLRSCCNRGGEGASFGTRFDLDICRAILGAYARETAGLLDRAEIELLFDAIRLIPFELGLRFLTDHLEGDRYFRVTERGQNLRKAWIQFELVEDIEGKEREIRRIIAECFGTQDNAREIQHEGSFE